MNLTGFLKKLLIFDVIWGRRTKIFKGLKDGGAKAAAIGDPTIAKAHNGSTIFNVNKSVNEPCGGHYHVDSLNTPDDVESVYCTNLNCLITDQVGDWVIIVSDNTVNSVVDNTKSHVVGVIVSKLTTTTCNIITHGKATVFSGLDSTKRRYFLSTSGGLTDVPPTTGYVLELGKAINSTTLLLNLTVPMHRS